MYGHNRDNREYQSRDRSREKHYRRDRSNSKEDHDRRRRRRSRSSSNSRKQEGSRHERHYHRQSRSRSREHRSNLAQSYEERAAEQAEHRLRMAIRNNEIQFDVQLLQILRNLPSNKQEQLTEQAQSLQKIHECILVRELFISGLSEMNQNFINEIMRQYGQIEKIEIIKNFAYVKFHKVQDASNACAEYHTINMRIHNMHNANFKIFFADHVKRWNVVSNSLNYENVQDLVPVIYASIRNERPFNTEAHIRESFEKFGFVRNIEMKPNEMPGPKVYKSYVLVEFETLAQALRARQKIRPYRQKYLGDRKSEVTLLIDSQKITRQYPNVKNQLRYQIKRQKNTITQSMTVNPMNPFMQQHNETPAKPMMNLSGNTNDIFDMIREITEKEPDVDQEQSDWVGFLTRNKQFKVEVDFNLIHKVPFELESILNVSHRADLQEGIDREDYVMAGKFRAANSLNVNAFQDYINYFIKKNKAGIIQSKSYLIYLLPPLESLPLPYSIKQDQLLALFFKL